MGCWSFFLVKDILLGVSLFFYFGFIVVYHFMLTALSLSSLIRSSFDDGDLVQVNVSKI